MAKKAGTKATEAEVGIEVLETDSGPVLDLVPVYDLNKNEVQIDGNFDAVKAYLISWRDKLTKKKLSAKDMETVAAYKKAATGYRTMLAAFEKDKKTLFFNAPKAVFSGMLAELQGIVNEVESKADEILSKEEEKRIADLTAVFDIYRDDFQAEYKLSPAGLAKVEYKKQYYNKTAVEAATKEDLRDQFRKIADAERSRALAEKTVNKLCKDNPLLDVAHYLRRLDEADLSIVMDEIEEEEERLKNAIEKAAPIEQDVTCDAVVEEVDNAVKEDSGKVVIGVMGSVYKMLEGGSSFPGRTKTMFLDVTYPCDMGDALTVIFKELAKYGIKATVRKDKTVF